MAGRITAGGDCCHWGVPFAIELGLRKSLGKQYMQRRATRIRDGPVSIQITRLA